MVFCASITLILIINIIVIDAFRIGNVECEIEPKPVAFSSLRCSSEKCEISCISNYEFPNAETKLDLECNNRRIWVAKNYNTIPACIPICNISCLNGGYCMAPNQCYCNQNFTGNRCQTQIATCPDKIPMPQNTMGRCITSGIQSCKVTCIQGHKFPDGTLSADLKCYSGQWQMEPRQFDRCEPYCNPPCMNGGTCIAPNLCQCSPDYRGNLCQYRTDNCSPQKIGFNGLYKCTGTYDKMECTISCPQGFDISFTPVSKYTCKYSEGFFTPQQVPQCDYRGMKVQILHA
ncbi:hypothetical protein PVAND_008768 [Polypedilum vanderplanki]|uniref:EGF-like domain-containing protein n=1 Tax=Polypedilum vanderplanki TaxID=319348 RepID=A0A9J6CAT7_POLVA|nr:hypothetical protein PVAND_008768 [Polypedilum vanderplanki]